MRAYKICFNVGLGCAVLTAILPGLPGCYVNLRVAAGRRAATSSMRTSEAEVLHQFIQRLHDSREEVRRGRDKRGRIVAVLAES